MTDFFDTGKQLGQTRPAGTSAASIYSPAPNVHAELLLLVVNENAGATPNFQVFHDEDGTTYDQTTSLFFNNALTANETKLINLSGIWMRNSAGNFAIRTSVALQITFTLYGIEREVK